MKRKTKNIIEKPNYSGINREIHGVLRDFDSNMVFSEIENGKVFYRQTNIKDLPIKPNNLDGRRGFHSGVWLKVLKNNVVNSNHIVSPIGYKWVVTNHKDFFKVVFQLHEEVSNHFQVFIRNLTPSLIVN